MIFFWGSWNPRCQGKNEVFYKALFFRARMMYFFSKLAKKSSFWDVFEYFFQIDVHSLVASLKFYALVHRKKTWRSTISYME